jgi:hypothetical protein
MRLTGFPGQPHTISGLAASLGAHPVVFIQPSAIAGRLDEGVHWLNIRMVRY